MILLTGCNGQVGQSIVKAAKDFSVELIPCDHQALDITHISSIENSVNKYHPDWIINTAAYTAVDKAESESEREKVFKVNSLGPENLAKICAEKNISLIHLSTDYIFDGNKTSAYIENDSANPQSIYGQSKWQGEEAVRKYCEKYLILRVSWVFSEYGNNFVKTILKLLKERDELRIVSDQIGCPTYAGDIAKVILKIISHPHWGTYHYCGMPETTWFDFAKKIYENSFLKEKIIKPITTAEYPTPAKRPLNSVLDCSLFIKTFNLPLSSWEKGLEQCMKNG
jgi:dTDP-4-dehydrorhamnose reductase